MKIWETKMKVLGGTITCPWGGWWQALECFQGTRSCTGTARHRCLQNSDPSRNPIWRDIFVNSITISTSHNPIWRDIFMNSITISTFHNPMWWDIFLNRSTLFSFPTCAAAVTASWRRRRTRPSVGSSWPPCPCCAHRSCRCSSPAEKSKFKNHLAIAHNLKSKGIGRNQTSLWRCLSSP